MIRPCSSSVFAVSLHAFVFLSISLNIWGSSSSPLVAIFGFGLPASGLTEGSLDELLLFEPVPDELPLSEPASEPS